MDLFDLIERQKEFDDEHSSKFKWSSKIDKSNLDTLEFLLISVMGELGETSNIVKKILRGDYSLEDKKKDLSEEVIDILIYVIKMIYQLDINVEEVYEEKMKKNRKRFERYETYD